VGYYREHYGKILEPLLRKFAKSNGEFHGSYARDVFIDYISGPKGFACDNHVEQWLRECVEDRVLVVLQRAPTVSQAAWIGLQYDQRSYDRLPPMTAGTVEHHWFRWVTVKSR